MVVGSVELSRAELISAIEDSGVPVSNTIARFDPAGAGFDQGILNVFNDLFGQNLDRELESRGLEASPDDVAVALAQNQLPPDFDLSELTEDERARFDQGVGLATLDRALALEGSNVPEWVTDLQRTIEIDPRYGSWVVDVGFVPPALPQGS